MTARDRTLVSVFLVWHLVAIGTSAVPSPADLVSVRGHARPADDDISRRVRPVADAVGTAVETLSGMLYRMLGFVRPVVSPYIDRLGLEQSWNMFANPPLTSEYLRMRYYVRNAKAGAAAPVSVTTELVFPAASETDSRLVRSFWQSHQDKAVSNAVAMYFTERQRRRRDGIVPPIPDTSDGPLHRSLLPVVQYFAGRYIASHPEPDGSHPVVVRSEAWYGTALSRAPDDTDPFTESHAAALAHYRAGRSSAVPAVEPWPGLDTVEREADIAWTLIFIHVP